MRLTSGATNSIAFQIIQAMPGNCALLLPDAPFFTILAATDGFIEISGQRKSELLGKGLLETFPRLRDNPSIESQLQASLYHVISEKEQHCVTLGISTAVVDTSNSGQCWSVVNKPILNEEGEVTFVVHTANDVTEETKRKYQAEHVMSMERAYNLFMNVPVIIGVVRGDSYIIDLANEGLLEVWGRNRDVIGKPLLEAIPELTGQGYIELLDSVRKTGEPYYATYAPISLVRNGKEEVLYFNFVYKPFTDSSEDASQSIIAVGYDVTLQVHAQQALEESRFRWELLANTMPVIVWTSLPDGRLTFFNNHWYTFTGLTEATSLDYAWVKVLHPDDAERCLAVWNHARDTESYYQIEVRYRHKDGHYRWMLARGVPVRDADGKVEAWYGTSTDIHEQKMLSQNLETLVEERTAELQQSNANLEAFAYAASHDLKEPVRKILFFSERIKLQLEDKLNEEQAFSFSRLRDATQRMGMLIDDLLDYAQTSRGITHVERVDLSRKVQQVLEDLDLEVEQKKARITIDLLPTITGNKRQMQQLFQNLLTNALKYSKSGTPPEIRISCNKVIGRTVKPDIPGPDADKSFYLIQVHDKGIGFEKEYAERIFNVFTRLHGNNEYKGTGIGLSIVQKVVQNHNGYIWAESMPGEGSTFSVLLPESSTNEAQ